MPSPLFDLLLLGYRNDLACERVLAYLRSLPESQGGPIALDRLTALPCTVRGGLDHDAGLRLLSELRERGAHVRLVAADVEPLAKPTPTRPAAEPVPPPPAPPARAAWFPTLLAVLGVAGAVFLRYLPPPRPLAPPPSAEPQPAVEANPFAIESDGSRNLNNQAVALNAAGQFADAAGKLRDAMRRAPDEPALRNNLKTVLHNWAVAELNADHTEAAVKLLEEGLALEEDATLLSALGIARVRQDEWAAARSALERAVALGASDPYTFMTLGKVYRQQGERAEAVEMFHRARDSGARGPDFEETLTRLERELDAEWDFAQMRSPHFEIAFAGGERESNAAAQAVATGLENAYFHDGRKLDRYPGDRVPVVLYSSQDFHDVTQTPSWTGGVYDGRIKLPSRGVEDQDGAVLERTLRHEYGHVLVTQLSRGRAPVWLNEGVAIWCEEERDGEREDWAYATLAGQVLFPLRHLEGSFTGLPPERVHAAYAQSYLAVHELVSQSGGRSVRNLLSALGEGVSLDDAFRSIYNRSFAHFENQFIKELTSG